MYPMYIHMLNLVRTYIYLRNKETQQTLWIIVGWFLMQSYGLTDNITTASKRQITASKDTLSVMYA